MLQKSFVHLPGIGRTTELKLWDHGVDCWSQLKDKAPDHFRGEKLLGILRRLGESEEAWAQQDLYFFYQHLPRRELWRLVPGFFEKTAFLDIETTGLHFPPRSHSTTITFYFQGQVYQEHEHDKKAALLDQMMEEASLFCTFNGEGFDLPFLRREFGLALSKAHVDLCPWLRRQGYAGGLKKVQQSFSHLRQRESMDIDGFDAVRLWHMHRQGMEGALETLLTYNAEDTVILEPLLCEAFNQEAQMRPSLSLERLNSRPIPSITTKVYPTVYEYLRS